MSTVTILLVNGYIRPMEKLLGDERIVPSAVYELCCLFYTVNVPLILWKRLNHYDGTVEVGGLDLNNLSSFVLKQKTRKSKGFTSLCHIPSIFRSLPNDMVSGSTFDAMLVTETPGSSTMSLILYDAADTMTKQTVNVQHEFMHSLNHEMWTENQFIFCPLRNSVIYEHKANLYEMDFNDIKTKKDLFGIKELKQDKKLYVVYLHIHSTIFSLHWNTYRICHCFLGIYWFCQLQIRCIAGY